MSGGGIPHFSYHTNAMDAKWLRLCALEPYPFAFLRLKKMPDTFDRAHIPLSFFAYNSISVPSLKVKTILPSANTVTFTITAAHSFSSNSVKTKVLRSMSFIKASIVLCLVCLSFMDNSNSPIL